MPFYEYECADCRHYVELLQKISDKPLKKCPSCGKNHMKRLVSAPVFRLKGSGWYETDFKSDKEGKRNLAAGESEDTKAAAIDVKPAPKPGDKPEKEGKSAEAPAASAAKESAGESRSAGSGKPGATRRTASRRPKVAAKRAPVRKSAAGRRHK